MIQADQAPQFLELALEISDMLSLLFDLSLLLLYGIDERNVDAVVLDDSASLNTSVVFSVGSPFKLFKPREHTGKPGLKLVVLQLNPLQFFELGLLGDELLLQLLLLLFDGVDQHDGKAVVLHAFYFAVRITQG